MCYSCIISKLSKLRKWEYNGLEILYFIADFVAWCCVDLEKLW
jgi:hypothetical protein